MIGMETNWEKELDEWLETTEHKYQCIGYSEGQCCCLDKPDPNAGSHTYGFLGRKKLKEIVDKAIREAVLEERENYRED